MKVRAHITGLVDQGDQIKITAQGNVSGRAFWVPMASIEISLPITDKNRAAYFIGRKFDLTVKPT